MQRLKGPSWQFLYLEKVYDISTYTVTLKMNRVRPGNTYNSAQHIVSAE